MVYVGHFFRWQPENDKLLAVARRWDYYWCRMWSDKSFDEVALMYHALRGTKTWLWCQDGNSLPYYLLTPVYRQRAINLGAQIKDWDNPQLPVGCTPVYQKTKYLEKEHATIAHQQETQRGTYSVLLAEEDLLKLASLLRDTGKDAGSEGGLHAESDPDSPC